MSRVRLEVHCDGCKSLLGTWYDRIAEKYPFACEECVDIRTVKWPWVLTASIVEDERELGPCWMASEGSGHCAEETE